MIGKDVKFINLRVIEGNNSFADAHGHNITEGHKDLPSHEDVSKDNEIKRLMAEQEADSRDAINPEQKEEMIAFDVNSYKGEFEAHHLADLMNYETGMDKLDGLSLKIFIGICKKANLTNKQANYIWWHDYLEIPALHIAESQGIDESTVRKHILAGSKKLNKYFKNVRLTLPLNTHETNKW